MVNKDINSNSDILDTLKKVLSVSDSTCLNDVSLDDDLLPYSNLSECELLGSAKSSFEEELNRKILDNERVVHCRLERLKSYDDTIF